MLSNKIVPYRVSRDARNSYDYISFYATEKMGGCSRHYGSRFVLEDVADAPRMSLAKSLACLPDDEPLSTDNHHAKSSMEQKRFIRLRIKKKVKTQYHNDVFRDLMDKVIADADTLKDCYDLVRLNSHVDLASQEDGLSFSAMAEQLSSRDFNVGENSATMYGRKDRRKCLTLPNLKLRVVEEAIRVVLEVVYRPHFSKISHGCRSGRGHRSALRYVQKEIPTSDWWFTISLRKVADKNVLCKLISAMEERIQDPKLFQIITQMFDAGVLNLAFGVFPKGHGLPQEGVLSAVLMNIYLDMFDSEVIRMSLRYEVLGTGSTAEDELGRPKLRCWIRRRIKAKGDSEREKLKVMKGGKLKVCRHMDEIIVSVSGSRDDAMNVKTDMLNFLSSSLHLHAKHQMDPVAVDDGTHVLQFLGTTVLSRSAGTEAVRAVHKLQDKVHMFLSQRQKIWDCLTVRIGKKWLGWGLRRIKESEIRQLGLSTPTLDYLSQFRKAGMKTDHWFKSLLKIWMQDLNVRSEADEKAVLAKFIGEPALPRDLKESFDDFKTQARKYVSSELAKTQELLENTLSEAMSAQQRKEKVISLEAPTSHIKNSLLRHGVVGHLGYPKHVPALVLQNDELIISWFSGLVQRWLKWYSGFENYGYMKLLIAQCVRKSCTRTLGAKYQVPEDMIERRYDSELSRIPMIDEDPSCDSSHGHDEEDEGLTYGAYNSGLCLLALSRVKVPTRVFNCFVMGCTAASPSMYVLHGKEMQRFPGWKTGFSSSIHPSLDRRRIGLCDGHVRDLYLGKISLQSVEFGALRK